ncbi:hypothetical protein P9D39_19540 [Heyndrickxia oleronia]|uniref:Uncharacterized protein n=1 Tax=Heyndrickxia oleronia TaxID=38875 RepID=A0A8E2LDK4_9BACI|nr:hypothetical protein [Heyndrickxia oleronia]MEC1376493.1 hypothetical protein [Heyndrickxia oleronia]OOP68140.1 hypothetical protein BWZ43_12215 [Heyndrickxia oleronia]QQZ06218.1 hypothetical protein I5818_07175 [Heyndrickxia oleronia]
MELIPKREPQKITYKQVQEYVPEKMEMYENNLFFTEGERIKMLLILLQNVGLETMVKNLPIKTRKELEKVMEEIEMERKCKEIVEQVVSQFGRSLNMNHEYQYNKKKNTLFIYCHILDTDSLWFYRYFYDNKNDKFIEQEKQGLESADTVRRLMNK